MSSFCWKNDPIIPEKTWWKAHQVIEDNVQTHAQHARAKEPGLLRELSGAEHATPP